LTHALYLSLSLLLFLSLSLSHFVITNNTGGGRCDDDDIDDEMMMMTMRWSLFSVVVDKSRIDFCGGKERGGGTRYEVTKDFSSKHYSYQYLFLLTHTQTTII
jgi:hypothetical protein